MPRKSLGLRSASAVLRLSFFTLLGCGALPFDRAAHHPCLFNASETDLILKVKYGDNRFSTTGLIVPRDVKEIETRFFPILELVLLDTLKDTLMSVHADEMDLSYERVQDSDEVWVYDAKGLSVVSRKSGWKDEDFNVKDSHRKTLIKGSRVLRARAKADP